jgi:nitrate/TMAO reductase-like tetraheme cytochrome c subunit
VSSTEGGGTESPPPDAGFRARLWRRPDNRWLLGIPAGGFAMFVLGAAALGGFNETLHATNTESFCANTCHEMRDFIYPEFLEQGEHASTRTGVHAGCPDCHVPRDFGPKILRKMQATRREVWAWVIGRIDTREKFDARRADLARDVWASMKATDSRECRSCHDVQRMKLSAQDRHAAREHERAAQRGKTCIDCHRGVAHVVPEGLADIELSDGAEREDAPAEGSGSSAAGP